MTKDRGEELEREIRTHLELEAEERIANGVPEQEARDAARRAFGNVTLAREDARAVWTRRWLDEVVQDVRYACRTLGKSPGFTTIAVLTIALAIGANTAMFSFLNGILLSPLPYPDPERVMLVLEKRPEPLAGRAAHGLAAERLGAGIDDRLPRVRRIAITRSRHESRSAHRAGRSGGSCSLNVF